MSATALIQLHDEDGVEVSRPTGCVMSLDPDWRVTGHAEVSVDRECVIGGYRLTWLTDSGEAKSVVIALETPRRATQLHPVVVKPWIRIDMVESVR